MQVSFDIMKECWQRYQSTVESEKNKYFSGTVSTNRHIPCVLFNTINYILNVLQSTSLGACEKFLDFFVDKVKFTRTLIPPFYMAHLLMSAALLFLIILSLSLPFLKDIIGHMKLSGSHMDALPSHLLKEVLPSVGSSILDIVNSSVTSRVVPLAFKHAVVQSLIKKSSLNPSIL